MAEIVRVTTLRPIHKFAMCGWQIIYHTSRSCDKFAMCDKLRYDDIRYLQKGNYLVEGEGAVSAHPCPFHLEAASQVTIFICRPRPRYEMYDHRQ